MAQNARAFTPAEAAVVSGLGRKAIDNAIDKRLVPIVASPSVDLADPGGTRRKRRLISKTDLLWIYVNSRAGGAIPVEARPALYERFAANVDAPKFRVSDLVIIDLAAARREVEARERALDRAKASIASDPDVIGGEPVFVGTRVPVYDVAASLDKGISRERILAAYPLLDGDGLDQALLYAEAFPPRGRPRGAPRTSPPLAPVKEAAVRRRPPG
ncbi:MAG TPA: DUF433 domain-containing protein [Allosphingosinicella sp.]